MTDSIKIKQSERPSYKKWYTENKERLIAKAVNRNKANLEQRRLIGKRHYAKHKERLKPIRKERAKARYWKDPERARQLAKAARQKLRSEFISAYGGCCACCKESEYAFLTLEHIYKDGAAHRKIYSTSTSILRQLKREGWPKDRYELLCFNCNRATHEQGVCPHRRNTK